MKYVLAVLTLSVLLVGCAGLYEDDGIPRISTQRQVDAYNATVSSDSEKLVCTRERPTGSNLLRFSCMTIAQHERLTLQAQEDTEFMLRAN